MQEVAEPANKLAVIGDNVALDAIHNKLFRSGFSSVEILKEVVRTTFLGIRFQEFSPFFEIVNGEVLRLLAGGILQHSWRHKINPKGERRVVEVIGPQVLSMDHLEIGFIICLIPLAIGIVVFGVEFLIPRIKVFMHRKLFYEQVLKAFMKK